VTKVLIVLTGAKEWSLKDGSRHFGGVWSPEFVYPHDCFTKAGYKVVIATLGGLSAAVDPASLSLGLQENDQASVDFQRDYLRRPEVEAALARPADDGSWPFAGKRMTGFPTSEMADFGVAQGAPWLPEVRLIKAGARYVQGQKHTDVVAVDGNLITGQNGASSKRTAQAVVDQVGKTANRVRPLVSALPD
jgi:putative intracellular protease/amidase